MESHDFDALAQSSAGAPTRRTVVRGLVAVLGSVGLGLGVGSVIEAKDKKKKNHNKKKQCNTKGKICATPLNPCATVECKKGKCVSGIKQNGTVCGDGLVCQAGACLCPNGVCTVKVTKAQQSNWIGYNDGNDTVNTSILQFVNGPANPPYGTGSVEITAAAGDRYNLATYQFSGTPLSEISTLKFGTYNPAGGPDGTGYLHFNVDFWGSDIWQRRLIWYPPTGSVVEGSWQEWDTLQNGAGLWTYSGATWPNDVKAGTVGKTWNQILTDYPNARIRVSDAFFGIRVGEPYAASFTENINSVTFGTATGTTRFVFGAAS